MAFRKGDTVEGARRRKPDRMPLRQMIVCGVNDPRSPRIRPSVGVVVDLRRILGSDLDLFEFCAG